MNEQMQNQKHTQETREVYAAVGRFAVAFEQVCHAMWFGIVTLLGKHGLSNQKLAIAVLDNLTAEPLRSTYQTVVTEIKGDSLVGDEKLILSNIMKRITELTKSRNDVIHRMWYVGWGATPQDDFTKVTGIKYKNTSKGVEFRPLEFSPPEFDALSQEADELAKLVNRINGCLTIDRPFSTNFVLAKDGKVTLPVGA